MVKLLIVEDNPQVRDLLTRRLNREGFQTITASNGVQTIVLARAELPDLILLDINLPILNGWQVAQRLRLIPETRTIPIIVLTGSLPPDGHQQFVATGCDAYEPKPINFPQLIAKIRWLASLEHTDGRQAREASAG
jgi:CheY-like chemotaxis protein